MKDRTEAQIRGTMMQMHNIAEAVFGEELDVIQTYIPDPPSGTNQALWYLGESIKMLSEADYFIGVYDGLVPPSPITSSFWITTGLVTASPFR